MRRVSLLSLLACLLVAAGRWCSAEPEPPPERDRLPRYPHRRLRDHRPPPRETPPAEATVSGPTDALGYYQESRRYASIADRGIAVVNLPQDESFFVYWVPPSGALDHVLVLLHGTGGTAYDELADELDLAQQRGYALVSLQWLNKRTGQYAGAPQMSHWLDLAVRYLEERFHGTVGRVGLSGFSRGGAMSYAVAYEDRMGAKHLSFVIAHSGGIPTDHRIARDDAGPGQFYADLDSGALGQPFTGVSFFLYAGCKDEQWGTTMCDYMRYTKTLLEKSGGTVAACIIDENGGHAGYVHTPSYHERAINLFLETAE